MTLLRILIRIPMFSGKPRCMSYLHVMNLVGINTRKLMLYIGCWLLTYLNSPWAATSKKMFRCTHLGINFPVYGHDGWCLLIRVWYVSALKKCSLVYFWHFQNSALFKPKVYNALHSSMCWHIQLRWCVKLQHFLSFVHNLCVNEHFFLFSQADADIKQ